MSMYLFAVISVPWVPEQEGKEEERGKGIGKENRRMEKEWESNFHLVHRVYLPVLEMYHRHVLLS